MKRNVTLAEISDGRLYRENDMVKAGCNDCIGCSTCCKGMGDTILLDPLDCYRLTCALKVPFEALLADKLELGVADGIILPHLKMTPVKEQCAFLNPEGRCSIHPYRPGICRIFPLGRYYEDGDFRYFLQTGECPRTNRTKVKVSKWIDIPDIKRNKAYLLSWHYFLKDCEEVLEKGDDKLRHDLNMYLLKTFFLIPYNEQVDFYQQFEERLEKGKTFLQTGL